MGFKETLGRLFTRAAQKGAESATRVLLEQVNKASEANGGPKIPIPDDLKSKKQKKREQADVIQGEVVADEAPKPAPHPAGTRATPRPPEGPHSPKGPSMQSETGRPAGRTPYPGDYTERVEPVYNPELDGDPDPGEVVWGWVPYEDDATQGKDRPVVLVGFDGEWLLGLMLTSKDHTLPSDKGLRSVDGRFWYDIGSGAWDSQGRPSEVRLDRVIRLAPSSIRREGAILPRETFATVVKLMRHARFGETLENW